MWSTKSCFGDRQCPESVTCRLPNCMFSHEISSSNVDRSNSTNVGQVSETAIPGREPKRRKLEADTKDSLSHTSRATSEKPQQSAFVGVIASKDPTSTPQGDAIKKTQAKTVVPPSKAEQILRSVKRPVSPPPVGSKLSIQTPKHEPKESLTPRLVPKDPAQFATRRALLLKLHEYMAKLNNSVLKSKDTEIKSLCLSENEVMRLAMSEEEEAATGNKSVYDNVVKNRILALKKMDLHAWIEERKRIIAKEKAARAPPKSVASAGRIVTGLSPEGEVKMLDRLVAKQTGLHNFGYVTKHPTEEEIDFTLKGIASAQNWEECDRCSTRFQVFPDRREDGALTSGGKCVHHWGRRTFQKKEKGEFGPAAQRMSCCNEEAGTPGCTVNETHVFKVSNATRLAAIMPFKYTPSNPKAEPGLAVCFDCEMGYTCYGLELIRLTAISWPSHKPLIDVLVRPHGAILDLNTRFSGVKPDHFFNAKEFDPKDPVIDSNDLRVVPSPEAARELLLSHITIETPLLGHALENDLNSVRLIHPTIIDTVLLYPHPRGLPIRNGLRALAKRYLDLDIQQAGAAGHDSLEDAKATGELVRFRVGKEWKKLQSEGWTVRDGGFYPPLPPTLLCEPSTSSHEPRPLPFTEVDPLPLAPEGPKKTKRTADMANLDGTGDSESESGEDVVREEAGQLQADSDSQ